MSRSSTRWLLFYVLGPLFTIVIKGVVRLIGNTYQLEWSTIDASTVCLSVAFMCLFVGQSLDGVAPAITNEEEVDDAKSRALKFRFVAISYIVLFAILVYQKKLCEIGLTDSIESQMRPLEILAFTTWPLPAIRAVAAQRFFKLK